jgi:histidyl-tRNA synthetase
MLLLERGFEVPDAKEKVAFLIEKKMPAERLADVFAEAQKERDNGKAVGISIMKKNKKFQKEQLTQEGYTDIREFFAD